MINTGISIHHKVKLQHVNSCNILSVHVYVNRLPWKMDLWDTHGRRASDIYHKGGGGVPYEPQHICHSLGPFSIWQPHHTAYGQSLHLRSTQYNSVVHTLYTSQNFSRNSRQLSRTGCPSSVPEPDKRQNAMFTLYTQLYHTTVYEPAHN